MRSFLVSTVIFFYTFTACAQEKQAEEDTDTRTFKKELLFAGGGISVSFFNNITMLGVSPHFGYSITSWLDAAVSMNVNYISQRNYFYDDDKVRQMIYAPGAFVRLYPFKFLYAEAHFERNFISQRYIYPSNFNAPDEKIKYNVNTMLIGLGYASDRDFDDDESFYISLSMDVLRHYGSPYTSVHNNPIPIIRAGVNMRLFHAPRKKRKH
jgi:hypothetical protein